MSLRADRFVPIHSATLRQNTADFLVQSILSGKFKPGERLNESELSRQLTVSRAPIREALHQLQEQGLVVNHPRRGMFVVSLTDLDVQKINSLRLILESEALGLCRQHLTQQAERKLVQQVERMDRAGSISALEAMRMDLHFHRTIWSLTGNEFLERTLTSVTAPLFAFSVVKKMSTRNTRMILDSHRPLLAYLQGGVAFGEARRIIYDHLSLRWGPADLYAMQSHSYKGMLKVKKSG